MRFKSGDIVIKNSGGNKMRIIGYSNSGVHCIWCSDKTETGIFIEDELLTLNEYKLYIISEKRNDIIGNILENN